MPPNALCLLMNLYLAPIFATWQCILFGAGAAAVLLLLSLALPMSRCSYVKRQGIAEPIPASHGRQRSVSAHPA